MALLSVAAGARAHRLAEDDARDGWYRDHAPGSEIWTYALGQRGYTAVRDPAWVHRVARGLPSAADPQGTAWITADAAWVCLLSSSDSAIPQVFARVAPRRSDQLPGRQARWELAGRGWDGFEAALERIRRAPPLAPERPRRPSPPRDPRLLLY